MITRTRFAISRFTMFLVLPVLLTGCLGPGDGLDSLAGNPKSLTGLLIDAPMGGVQYTASSAPTVVLQTNIDGEFEYLFGDTVTFSIGGIVLGTLPGADVITPVELTGSTDATDQTAVNMMVFLQSIDLDNNPLNGITVNEALLTAAETETLDFSSATFTADVTSVVNTIAPGSTVISESDALDNFYDAYQRLGGSFGVDWTFTGYPDFPVGNANLLTNGNFDDSPGTNSLVCGNYDWACYDPNLAYSVTTADANPTPSPRSGARMIKTFGKDGASLQTITAIPGVTYTAKAYAQNLSGAGNELLAEAILFLNFFDENMVLMSEDKIFGRPSSVTGAADEVILPTDTWTLMEATAEAPEGAAFVQIVLFHNDFNVVGGQVFWDDAELLGPDFTVAAPPLPVADLVQNGSFEVPDASAGDVACSDGWSCFDNGAGGASFTTAMGPAPHAGLQVLKQFGKDDTNGAFQDFSATSGETYTASAWVMEHNSDPLNNVVALQLFFLDSGGNVIGGTFAAQQQAMPSACSFFVTTETLLVQDVWTELSVAAVAPANAVTARIQLLHENLDLASNLGCGVAGGSAFWDNATLVGPTDGRTLVWAEEFNGAVLDSATWTPELGYGSNGWGNDEWQQYTDDASNIEMVDTGSEKVLRITADCSEVDPANCGKRDGSITSARIATTDKFEFSFGRLEARIRVPGELASWPAFWMLGAKFPETGWPKSGEIDILEVFDNKFQPSGAVHYCDESMDSNNNDCANFPSGYKSDSGHTVSGIDLAADFHIYELEWDATRLTMSIDGQQYFTKAIEPSTMEEFLEDFFLILNVAVGGNPVSNPTASTTWPMIMDVDYIRVYQ